MTSGLPDYTLGVSVTIIVPSPDIGRPKSYEETIVTAGSVATHHVNTDLGKNGGDGYIYNKGDGDLYIYISDDGTNFNGGAAEGSSEKITISKNHAFSLTGLNVHTIKIDASEDNTDYRIVVV